MEIRSVLAETPQVVPARGRISETLYVTCHFFKVLLEVQHPVQAHAKILWSLLKHQALVIDKHVQFPFSSSVIDMVGGRNCAASSEGILPGCLITQTMHSVGLYSLIMPPFFEEFVV